MVNVYVNKETIGQLTDKLLTSYLVNPDYFPWTTLDTTKMSHLGRSKTNWFAYYKNEAGCQLSQFKLAMVPNNAAHVWDILRRVSVNKQMTQKERLVVFHDTVIDHFTNIVMDVYHFKFREAFRALLHKLILSDWLLGDKAGGLSIEAITLVASVIAAGDDYSINSNDSIRLWESMWVNWRSCDRDPNVAFTLLFTSYSDHMLEEIKKRTPKAAIESTASTVSKITPHARLMDYEPKLDGMVTLLGFEVEYPVEGIIGGFKLKFNQLLVGSDRPKDPSIIIYSQNMAYIADLPGGIGRKWAGPIARNSPLAAIGSLIIMPEDNIHWVKMPSALVITDIDKLHVISNTANLNRLIEI